MTGGNLRKRVWSMDELMDSVEEFMRQKKALSAEASNCIQQIRDLCEDLGYMIPLE